MQKFKAALLGCAIVLAALPARAVPLLFQLSGSKSATFQLDSSPTPDTFSSSFLGSQIQFNNLAGTFAGAPGTASSIGFGTGPILAQLNVNGTALGFAQFGGPDLFSGPANAPVFTPGSFALSSIVSGASTLTISALLGQAIPEPSSLPVALASVAMLGLVIRFRKMRS